MPEQDEELDPTMFWIHQLALAAIRCESAYDADPHAHSDAEIEYAQELVHLAYTKWAALHPDDPAERARLGNG